jgi:hypothetical protein
MFEKADGTKANSYYIYVCTKKYRYISPVPGGFATRVSAVMINKHMRKN